MVPSGSMCQQGADAHEEAVGFLESSAPRRQARCVRRRDAEFTKPAKVAEAASERRIGRSIADEGFGRWPKASGRHVQGLCQCLSPGWRSERLAPVVRHTDRLSVAELGYRDVPVKPAVPIISSPLDD
jgi:hypothetical protein